jgi:CO/xanthine dehydrogenase Mo-binding subunit
MFGSDFVFPGTLYARVLACPHAHAKITSMDTSKAEAYPGVRKIVRYDEPSNPYIGIVALPQRGLFEGEPMGVAVIADTDEIAQDALRLIEIEWEILPFALECVDALEPDFPVVVNSRAMTATTDKASNRIAGPTATQVGPEGIALGDVQEGFSQADHIIQFTGSRAENMAKVEPTHASFVYKDGIIEQACPGQFDVGRFVAIPTGAKNTYQHPTFSGGGFGLSYPVAMVMGLIGGALCQQVPGTPVKVMFDLQQSNFYTMSNDCNNDNFKVGFKDDGTITAVQCDSHINGATFESTLVHFEENTCVPNIQDNYTASWVNRPQAWACRSEQRMCITA